MGLQVAPPGNDCHHSQAALCCLIAQGRLGQVDGCTANVQWLSAQTLGRHSPPTAKAETGQETLEASEASSVPCESFVEVAANSDLCSAAVTIRDEKLLATSSLVSGWCASRASLLSARHPGRRQC